MPQNGAEDSVSFLSSALAGAQAGSRMSLVSHSIHGEFAYRDDSWKLVFRNRSRYLEESRGQPTVSELYNPQSDVGEQQDSSGSHPEMAQRVREAFDRVIARGASRSGQQRAHDTAVCYNVTQTERWAPRAD